MDNVQIEIKDEFTHQQLQFENNSFAESSIENTDILDEEEVHIKDQLIDQRYILSSQENTKFTNSSIVPIIKQEIPETCDKYKPFNEPEKLGIFVKSERNIKPKNSFDINDYDSNLALSTVSSDPLEIPVHERKSPINIHDAALDVKKHLKAKHIIASTLKMNIVKVDPHEANNQSNDQCKFCLEFVEKSYMKEHLLTLHSAKCPYCPKKFREVKYMNVHVAKAHPPKIETSTHQEAKKQYQCQLCPEKFMKKVEAYRHLKSKHAIIKHLNKHLNIENEDNKQSKTAIMKHLNKHLNSENEENKQSKTASSTHKSSKCSVCLKVFVYASELQSHFSRYHASSQPLWKGNTLLSTTHFHVKQD